MIILEGRKIPREYENPLDDQLLLLCDKLADICIKYNITANQITLVRFYFMFVIYHYLINTNEYIMPIFFSFLFYLFDCLDGHLARKTNSITVLGDLLDHGTDFIFFIIIVYFIYKNKYYKLIVLVFVSAYLSCVHLGIQQKNNKILKPNESTDETLDLFNYLHPFDHTFINISKYVGSGTLMIVMLGVIYYIQTKK